MSYVQQFDSPQEALAHYGVKGMHWGVRRDRSSDTDSNLNIHAKGVTVRSDGSMTIQPGASLQRLVRSSGKSMPMKDLTYASMLDYDNARYVKIIGGKGFLGGGRDQILGITATKKITAPSKEEATRMISDLMINDPTFRKRNTSMLGEPISKGDLKRIVNDPVGKTAQAWYEMTNTKLTFDKEFDSDAPYVQKVFRETMAKRGFNAIRDENDVAGKVSKAPIIIFSPEKSLKVTSVTNITDEIRAANKAKLKEYKKLGRNWAEKQLYD